VGAARGGGQRVHVTLLGLTHRRASECTVTLPRTAPFCLGLGLLQQIRFLFWLSTGHHASISMARLTLEAPPAAELLCSCTTA
jgi:hypothetical protein